MTVEVFLGNENSSNTALTVSFGRDISGNADIGPVPAFIIVLAVIFDRSCQRYIIYYYHMPWRSV